MPKTVLLPLGALVLGIVIGVVVPWFQKPLTDTCEAQDGSRVPVGTVQDGAICTNLVPAGWAVEASQEADNGETDN